MQNNNCFNQWRIFKFFWGKGDQKLVDELFHIQIFGAVMLRHVRTKRLNKKKRS